MTGKKVVEMENHHLFAEISKEFGYDCGITICGEYDESDNFQMEYYFPYFAGSQITSYEEVVVERHAEKSLMQAPVTTCVWEFR